MAAPLLEGLAVAVAEGLIQAILAAAEAGAAGRRARGRRKRLNLRIGVVMVETSTLLVFLLAAFALLVVPGPSVLYVVARGVAQGRAAGFISALGVGTGALVHCRGRCGRVVGAAGGVWRSPRSSTSAPPTSSTSVCGRCSRAKRTVRRRLLRHVDCGVFAQGAVVEALNPKTARLLPRLPAPVRRSRARLGRRPDAPARRSLRRARRLHRRCVCAGGGHRRRLAACPPRVVLVQRDVTGTTDLGLGVSTALAGAIGK